MSDKACLPWTGSKPARPSHDPDRNTKTQNVLGENQSSLVTSIDREVAFVTDSS